MHDGFRRQCPQSLPGCSIPARLRHVKATRRQKTDNYLKVKSGPSGSQRVVKHPGNEKRI